MTNWMIVKGKDRGRERDTGRFMEEVKCCDK